MSILKKIITSCYLIFIAQISLQAQNTDVLRPVNLFIEGTTYNYPEKILESFIPGGEMYLFNDADTLMLWPVERYAALYDNGRQGQENQRFSSLISLDVVGNVAYAKLQVDIPSFSKRFYDLLLLKKINEEWKIVSKCTDAIALPKTPDEAKPKPEKEVILEDLARPWSMAFISENEVLIAEKDGDLLHVDLLDKTRKALKGLPNDIADEVMIDTSKYPWGTFPPSAHGASQRYNAGLFQVLLDPNFNDNGYVYLSYASENEEEASALKVVRAVYKDDALENVETLFLAGPHSHGLFHYGGGMVFGQDGKLYISTGERNLFEINNPSLPLAQDISDPRGKIIRINPDGSIPDDNPDFGPEAVSGLYALGIRAAQGLTIDPETGEIWFSEHGTLQGDELNKLVAGANYGWPYKTSGRYRTEDYQAEYDTKMTFTDPIHSWDQTIAPTGLTFYSGRDFPQWDGNLIIPGLSKGSLWRVNLKDDEVKNLEELFVSDRLRLRKAVVSPRGQLYILTDEEDGKLIKVVQAQN